MEIEKFCNEVNASAVVTDFSPFAISFEVARRFCEGNEAFRENRGCPQSRAVLGGLTET